MTRVGVIGLGFMGRTHLSAYRQLPDVTVVGVASRPGTGSEKLAAEVGGRYYETAEQLLSDPEIDAVSITVPTYLHRDLTLAALDAGKHVLVEKPLGLTVEDCTAISERAERSGRVVMVGHVLRFWPAYVRVVEIVEDGKLGLPVAAFAERLSSPPRWSSWLGNPELSGGAVHDFHIHDLDVLNWIFGRPEMVFAAGRRGDGGGWDHVVSQVRYKSPSGEVWGVASASTLLPDGYPFTTRLRVLCEKGAVELTERFEGAQVDSGSSGSQIVVYEGDGQARRVDVEEVRDAYLIEISAFVRAVRQGRGKSLLDHGTMAVRTALAARRSLESGLPVPVA